MKKKFDFTAEMNEAQIPLNDPKNDFLEEEKQLLEKNAQRIVYLANLHTSFLCNLIYPTFSRILLYSC